MYEDYDVIYKSNLNEFLMLWIIVGIIGILLLLFTVFSMSKVYKKANRSGIAPWIPIYNIYSLIEIANLPIVYFILSFIPIVNLYVLYKTNMSIATLFKKSKAFGWGLFFLPFIFYPMLAFSDSEYVGINLIALEGTTTVEDIPVIDDNKNKEITVEVNDNVDVSSSNINISIGGGKYQKEYTSNLVDVDKEKVVNKIEAAKEEKQNRVNKFIQNQVAEEKNVEPVKNSQENQLFSVPFISTEPKQEEITPTTTKDNVIPKPIMPSNPAQVKTGEYSLCPNCGTRINGNSKICFVCGQKLE